MEDEIYSALLGNPQNDDTAKLAALARKLRGQSNMGLIAQVSGDRVLSPIGKQMMDTSNTQAQDYGSRAERARYRGYQEKASAAANDRELAAQAWREKDAIAERENRLQVQRMQEAGANARNAATTGAATGISRAELIRGQRQISSDLTKANLPFLNRSYTQLDDALAPFKDSKTGKYGVIEGIGPMQNVLPLAMIRNPNGRKVKQAVANIRNQFLRMASGQAVTNPEAARQYEAIGIQLGGTQEDVLNGLEAMRALKDAEEQNIYAGYHPAVVEAYEGNRVRFGGSAGGTGDWGDQPEAAAPTIPSFDEWKAQRDKK